METQVGSPTNMTYLKRLTLLDWLFALLLSVGAGFALSEYHAHMDVYEQAILVFSVPVFAALGWNWKPVRGLMTLVAALSLFAIMQYGHTLTLANEKFFLKYLLSSQSAILWMCTFFVLSTLVYWAGLLMRSEFAASFASGLCWSAVVMGLTGLMVRWYESYLLGSDIGHIPVSNLYEVFILFSLITALFYLFYEERYQTKQLGAFVLMVISAAVMFLLWYTVSRDAAEIQPLVPALQSWWMKIHVPANFIGYGTFSLAAMVAWIYLLRHEEVSRLWVGLVAVPLSLLVFAWGIATLNGSGEAVMSGLMRATKMVAVLVLIFAATILTRQRLLERMPSSEVLDDVMYKAISVGFIFFTIATILGALWAAEAWGGYWSWDPKETWALIVWLNYAAWLHMRLMKGLRGQMAAWWSLVGLLVTTFAFLGVNMFLSGLHSYGSL